MRTVAIVQARMGSKRLPGKTLRTLAGRPVLEWVVERLSRATLLDDIVVATSDAPMDRVIADFCSARGWSVFQGNESDVLDRFYRAAEASRAGRVVRVTADCPLIDAGVVDQVIAASREGDDYVSNIRDPRSFPRGLDVELFSLASLERSWREDNNPAWREHVDEYVLHHPELFRIRDVRHPVDFSFHRWTLDTQEDAVLLENILGFFKTADFHWQEVLSLLDHHPEWLEINSSVHQVTVDPQP